MKVIVLAGPESSGKSSLAAYVQQHFGGIVLGEYVREYIDTHQRDTHYADIDVIAREQLMREDAARQVQPPLLVLDTHLLSNMLWSQALFQDCPAWLEPALLSRHYDMHLLLAPEGMPWIADGQRCQPDLVQRQAFYRRCEDWLIRHQQPWLGLTGNWPQRQATAIAAVARLLGTDQRI
jgi:nicotinamide riboside kinase